MVLFKSGSEQYFLSDLFVNLFYIGNNMLQYILSWIILLEVEKKLSFIIKKGPILKDITKIKGPPKSLLCPCM